MDVLGLWGCAVGEVVKDDVVGGGLEEPFVGEFWVDGEEVVNLVEGF